VTRTGTYSLVARDPDSGELGVAVQSHWFSVGSIVPWARPGIGAVATQSVIEVAYGPRSLDRMQNGESAQSALAALIAADDLAAYRQVAVIGADGPPAVHTGEGCIEYAGHAIRPDFSAQANMMAADRVWPAMADTFDSAGGPLAGRLLAALRAAEAEGGDARGRQSAALVVVPAAGEPWRHSIELRVEDHEDPLGELERLLSLHGAYALASEGDELAGQGHHAEAAERYEAALRLAPDNHELLFWGGLAAALNGDLESGLRRVRSAIDQQPGWRQLLERLGADIAPSAAAVREALGRAN
jgi:uncharacterized Ntn-hydrolase superfamily protein